MANETTYDMLPLLNQESLSTWICLKSLVVEMELCISRK